jgi:glycosyltransferase 2 family protein
VLGFLAYRAARDPQFGELLAGQKNWPLLAVTLPLCLLAVTVTILRWHLLLGALGLSFSLRETCRAGYLGYLANLLPFGLVAGDSLKAVMLIHRNPRQKTEAVASVLIDRVLGLYSLLLLAAIASAFLPAEQLSRLTTEDRIAIQRLAWSVQTLSLLSSIGLAVMLIPAVTHSRLWDLLEHAPVIGRILHKLVGAMRAYRQRLDLMVVAIGVSLIVHLLYVAAIGVMTLGIGIAPQHRPSLSSIFVIVPPSMIAGALPIGFYEVAITLLFRAVSPPAAPENMGLLIALGYRIVQILIATIGIAYWLAGRREVRELMHEAEQLPPEQVLEATAKPAS